MADLVIDASVASAWCYPDERTEYTQAVFQAVSSSSETLAPDLWAYEIRNSLLMGVRRGRITPVDAEDLLVALGKLGVQLCAPVSFDPLFRLAHHHGLTIYDAAYLDLALREGLPLATLDRQLLKAAQDAGVKIFPP
jgi:predicted nucleic acid-binding protein